MRILHLDAGRELRGGQRQLLLLAQGLTRRGHAQTILARAESPLYSESLRLGFRTLPMSRAALAAAQPAADLVHAHDAQAHKLAVLCRPGPPLIVSRRVAFPVRRNPLSRWKYRTAARYLAVSGFVRSELIRAGVASEKIAVVYDGVPLSDRPPWTARERLVVAPATSDRQKGTELAVTACRLAGVELKLSERLEKDLPRASLFLYLTYSEGLGSAILLAMARGTPVVASRIGGIPEIVEHDRTGLLVENSLPAVAASLRNVFEDPDAARQRVEAAYRQVCERFTDDIMVCRTEQEYRVAMGIETAAEPRPAAETR
jgi:glycosyltransferase involved in cell wall biosynthesis